MKEQHQQSQPHGKRQDLTPTPPNSLTPTPPTPTPCANMSTSEADGRGNFSFANLVLAIDERVQAQFSKIPECCSLFKEFWKGGGHA